MTGNLSEAAGLDPEVVRVLAECHTGYGSALLRDLRADEKSPESLRMQLKVAASSFVLGATAYALFDPTAARTIFRAAAHAYSRLGTVAGIIYDICGVNQRPQISDPVAHAPIGTMSPDDSIGILLLDSWLRVLGTGGEVPSSLLLAALGMSGRASLSGLPVGLFQRLWSAFSDFAAAGELAQYVTDPLYRIIRGYGDVVELARADRFHWASMQTRALPLQPCALASAIIVLQRATGAADDLRRSLANDRAALLMIDVAAALVEASDNAATLDTEPLTGLMEWKDPRDQGDERGLNA